MAGKKKKTTIQKHIHVCCNHSPNRDLEIIRQGIQLISAILLRMWQDEQAENNNTYINRNSTYNQED